MSRPVEFKLSLSAKVNSWRPSTSKMRDGGSTLKMPANSAARPRPGNKCSKRAFEEYDCKPGVGAILFVTLEVNLIAPQAPPKHPSNQREITSRRRRITTLASAAREQAPASGCSSQGGASGIRFRTSTGSGPDMQLHVAATAKIAHGTRTRTHNSMCALPMLLPPRKAASEEAWPPPPPARRVPPTNGLLICFNAPVCNN
mmetsp:Transcript_105889/g.304285  ORF Transcript_105889/g.304285 Transcript_105889/m.304285 type:complete len:201 (+) Transcript_105889:830-1432(+)